jgi:hypothetical protein
MKEGSTISLNAAMEPLSRGENREAVEVIMAVGANGTFELLEEDGTGRAVAKIQWVTTPVGYTQATGLLEIGPACGLAII